jgi:hypothetical protein
MDCNDKADHRLDQTTTLLKALQTISTTAQSFGCSKTAQDSFGHGNPINAREYAWETIRIHLISL